jgi:Rrf2 family transcriptional regulator, iron-sulfur cluster assembly transcription factor
MILSKSFGYALRSVLYLAAVQEEKKIIQLQEIAEKLDVPKHFLGKVMKRLAKKGIIDSSKGHAGGYALNATTLKISVIDILNLIEGEDLFRICVIGFKTCSANNPCPLHDQFAEIKSRMVNMFSETKVSDLLKEDRPAFIRSLVTTG